ncbi:MAG TPA: hypothetical protein VEX41_11215, partial [Candidatus Eisenbacteria bacterium]|nr:hypothetical protein [Candidatus Eisenbacteria bacterium]
RRTVRGSTPPAIAPGTTPMARIASGPTYPPRTKAPSVATAAAMALVSGLRRWYGLGVGGASDAR